MKSSIIKDAPLRGEDLTGRKFGKRIVTRFAGLRKFECGSLKKVWECKCECGGIDIEQGGNLKSGRSNSCGCDVPRAVSEKKLVHGKHGTRFYWVWAAMIQRCHNPNNKQYHAYGGRGISVCGRWMTFTKFHEDMWEEYGNNVCIERVDNNSGYRKNNCIWTNGFVQANNKRTNVLITLNGKTKTIAQWSRLLRIPQSRIQNRYFRGWPARLILSRKKYDASGAY